MIPELGMLIASYVIWRCLDMSLDVLGVKKLRIIPAVLLVLYACLVLFDFAMRGMTGLAAPPL